MNPNNHEFIHIIWLKFLELWKQIDHAIEKFVQQTIDELEEIHQQE